jgi:hypothetical protein
MNRFAAKYTIAQTKEDLIHSLTAIDFSLFIDRNNLPNSRMRSEPFLSWCVCAPMAMHVDDPSLTAQQLLSDVVFALLSCLRYACLRYNEAWVPFSLASVVLVAKGLSAKNPSVLCFEQSNDSRVVGWL